MAKTIRDPYEHLKIFIFVKIFVFYLVTQSF